MSTNFHTPITFKSPLTVSSVNNPLSELDTKITALDSENAVTGPGSSINNNIASFDGVDGQTLQDSGITSTDIVTASASAASANNVIVSAGADKTIKYSGVTIDSSDNIATSGTLDADGVITAGNGAGFSAVVVDGGAGANRRFRMYSNGVPRFDITLTSSPESGGNAGSNLAFRRLDDSGGFLGLPLIINRATGDIDIAQDLTIGGTLSKGSGTFRINHPLPHMNNSHFLRYEMVEGPRAFLLYSGNQKIEDYQQTINLSTYFGMTEGTTEALHQPIPIQVFVNAPNSWSRVRGKIQEGNLLIETHPQDELPENVDWLVIAERGDEFMKDADYTDDNGRVINEHLRS